jgi:threonine/homoserine/homoserine lactone efflux protein
MVSVIVVLIVGGVGESRGKDDGVSWFKVAMGMLLLVMAAKQWNKRPKDGQELETPRWMSTIETAPPRKAAGLGALLSGANPKNLALTLAAAASVADLGLSSAQKVAAIAVYVVLGSVAVAGPVLFYLLGAERAERPLDTIRGFMSQNNAVIMMVVLLLLGAKLLGDGLTVV